MRTVVDAILAHRGGPGTLTAPGGDGVERQVSWAAVHANALRTATVLSDAGVGRGTLLAIRAATDHDAHHPCTWLSWLPLHHEMGLLGFCVLPMSCGCPLVLQDSRAFLRRPEEWLDAVARHRVAVSGGPNFAYGLAVRALAGGPRADLTSLRLLISGGEPVDAALMAELVRLGRPCGLDPAALLPAYGLVESTLALTFSRLGAGVRTDRVDPLILEAEGRAVPGTRALVRLGTPVLGAGVRITHRVTGEPLGERRVGHIEVSGPSVVGHYWGDPPLAGRWLRTGDLGYVAEGELVVCGREKDVLFAAGRNIYPQDVEAVAATVAAVRRSGVAAFGVPHGAADLLVVAVESSLGGEDTAAVRREVTAAVAGQVGLAPAVVLVLPPGRLPKTASGKLRRSEARARYLSGELAL